VSRRNEKEFRQRCGVQLRRGAKTPKKCLRHSTVRCALRGVCWRVNAANVEYDDSAIHSGILRNAIRWCLREVCNGNSVHPSTVLTVETNASGAAGGMYVRSSECHQYHTTGVFACQQVPGAVTVTSYPRTREQNGRNDNGNNTRRYVRAKWVLTAPYQLQCSEQVEA